MQDVLPVLYSFRRCPYAMRARMAILRSGIQVELREVVLREMPPPLLACSPKGTVPVLVLPEGRVIDESRDIMAWALVENDPAQWLPEDREGLREDTDRLMDENDYLFKQHLDHYKYAERYPEHPASTYRTEAEGFLRQLEQRLERRAWLVSGHVSIADIAIFPFVRQFALVDRAWFDGRPWPRLQVWLNGFLESALFLDVMQKYPQWQEGNELTLFPE